MAREPEGSAPTFETKSAWAYRRLREMIAEGELAAGSRLVLRRLAEDFGLSEMPVREALRMLQRDGLVEFESHRGATVVAISREEVLEGISVRMWLEVLAVREATPRHDAASLASVRRALGRVAAALEREDASAFSVANRELHKALEAPAGELLTDAIDDLWNRVWQARRTLSLFLLRPEQMRTAQEQHEQLAVAAAEGDADRAARVMEAHRLSSLAAWRDALGVDVR